MTVTRYNIETILVHRCGKLMSFAGLSTTKGTRNLDLNDPIGYGLRKTGYTVANPALVSDSDLANLSNDDLDQFLDIAEYRLLENIAGNLDSVDIRTGPYSENLSQIAAQLETRMNRLQMKIENEYGIGGGTFEGGTILLDFAEHNEEMSEAE